MAMNLATSGPEAPAHAASRSPRVLGHRVRVLPDDGHERATHEWICRAVAELFEATYGGPEVSGGQGPAYLVPDDTLDLQEARRLGIRDAQDLLGGVVPYPFLATKVVSHPLVGEDAARVDGWDASLGLALRPSTLPGYSAFHADDARQAFALLGGARVRFKLPTGIGGQGQWVLDGAMALDEVLAGLPEDYLATHGVVLERQLERVVTFSVGEVECAGLRIAYHGTQIGVPDRAGREVYGGSDLSISRGTLDELEATGLSERLREVVRAARDYDRRIRQAYPELLLSRRNYDVACGSDAQGRHYCGVLEQSWRVGGATPAELAALAAFRQDPRLDHLRACTRELYGAPAPSDVEVYYSGDDPRSGPITKYRAISRF